MRQKMYVTCMYKPCNKHTKIYLKTNNGNQKKKTRKESKKENHKNAYM